MACYSPLKGYKSISTGGIVFRRCSDAGERMEVACGQCLGCRIDRTRMWAMRITHEASLYDENCFITLTYRDEAKCNEEQFKAGHYIPADGSLNKSHFQKFMKRLRERVAPRKVRYYHCGEYGKEGRPHYHACLFNFDFSDKELLHDKKGVQLFTSETLENIWPYGFSTVGQVSFQSAAYCARYVLKKVNGRLAEDHYLRCDADGVAYWLQPEYTTMSRRPGIGYEWFQRYKSDVFPADEVPVPSKGVFRKVPRYYQEVFGVDSPETLEEVKARRAQYFKENKEEFEPDRLYSKYLCKKAQVSQLIRSI